MKRILDYYLIEWKKRKKRKPLLLRGARQVGKTYAARKLGKSFSQYIEINLEENGTARKIFSEDHDIKRILFQLSELFDVDVDPGSTLIFIGITQKTSVFQAEDEWVSFARA